MRHVGQWITESPYCLALGIEFAAIETNRCLLRLPFQDANANPSGVRHGALPRRSVRVGGAGTLPAGSGSRASVRLASCAFTGSHSQ
jgi:hypothetical protein